MSVLSVKTLLSFVNVNNFMSKKHNDDCINNDCNYCRFDINTLISKVRNIKTQDEARQCAIDWQNWSAEQNLSYGELAEYGDIFVKLADRFGLQEEFKENGII